MNFTEYEQRFEPLYAEFAGVVRSIFGQAIAAAGGMPTPQSIQYRAKAASHVKPKLEARGLLRSDAIEQEIRDLAGVRLIFYTNTDVDRFLNTGLIWENFELEEGSTRIHHPRPENEGQRYQAIHYMVRLNADRTKLPEYARFAGMRCEVQIQTILNHAWAETSHDILYKRPESEGFGKDAMQAIEKRMMRIMDEYLLPSGYEMQKVQHDFERLMQGKELFDRGALELLKIAKDNNERHDILSNFKEYLLPNYDDIAGVYPELLASLLKAAVDARDDEQKPIQTPFGELPGSTGEEVVKQVVEIISNLRYVNVGRTLTSLMELYRNNEAPDTRTAVMNAVGELSRYDLAILRQAGVAVQMELSTIIEQLSGTERLENQAVLIRVWKAFLSTEVRGVTWSADAATISTGAMPASSEIDQIRDRTIAGLSRLFDQVTNDDDRREIAQALWEATRLPIQGAFSNELCGRVVDDTARIVAFFAEHVDRETYALRADLEHRCLIDYHRWKPVSEEEGDRFQCKDKINALLKEILAYRDAMNADEQYVRYKTLVGFQSVLPWQWESDPFDFTRSESYRREQIATYVDKVTSDNQEEWYTFIVLCAATRSNDGATFPIFGEFLAELAKRKPAVAIGFLSRGNEDVQRFLTAFLDGLSRSQAEDAYRRIIDEYTQNGVELRGIAQHWYIRKPDRPAAIVRLLAKAIEIDDRPAIRKCVGVAVANHEAPNEPELKDFFVPAMKHLTAKADTRWLDETWYQDQAKTFFPKLSDEEISLVLDNLVTMPRLDTHADAILSVIARSRSEMVWRFFGSRLERQRAEGKEDKYEAIPYQFVYLGKPLAQTPEIAVDLARTWYDPDRRAFFQFEGGRLLHSVFNHFPDAFAAKLMAAVESGNADDIDFVLAILRNFNADPRTQQVMKAIAAHLPDDGRQVVELEACLFDTGVVSGEFGIADAYRRKKAEIAPWLEDERPRVRLFAERAIGNLDLRVAYDQRRAELHRELRRREFDA